MMKTFRQSIVILTLGFSSCLNSCSHNENKSTTVTIQKKFNYQREIAPIINLCIEEFVPKQIIEFKKSEISKDQQLTLYVHEKLYVMEQEGIDTILSKGASNLLKGLIYKRNKCSFLLPNLLTNMKGVNVTTIPPLTSSEINLNIGGVQFSKIIFNQQKTKASCIFEYTYKHQVSSNLFIIAEFKKVDEQWELTNKIEQTKSKNVHLLETN